MEGDGMNVFAAVSTYVYLLFICCVVRAIAQTKTLPGLYATTVLSMIACWLLRHSVSYLFYFLRTDPILVTAALIAVTLAVIVHFSKRRNKDAAI